MSAVVEIRHSADGVTAWSTPVEVTSPYLIDGLPNGEDHFIQLRSKNSVSGYTSPWTEPISQTPHA